MQHRVVLLGSATGVGIDISICGTPKGWSLAIGSNLTGPIWRRNCVRWLRRKTIRGSWKN